MSVFFSPPGVISCAGFSRDELWASLISANQSGIQKYKAQTGDEFFVGCVMTEKLPKTSARFPARITQIEEAALTQIEQFIFAAKEKYGKDRIAVCVGSCDNGTEYSFPAHKFFFEHNAFPENYSLEMQGADYVASFIKEKYAVAGSAFSVSTACSSSAGAIIRAAQLIKAGFADAAIAGGVDIASDLALLGFHSLEAISPDITNPLSKNRRGITLGDAASFFVLAKDPFQNEADVILRGYGETSDAHHITSPLENGEGAARAMQKALVKADVSADKIDYVNLHGTGTKLNDAAESRAMHACFKNFPVPASSTKSLTGHTLGAAGALECAVCYETLVRNAGKKNIMLPKQKWDGVFDESFPRVNIADEKNQRDTDKVKLCMSNSFAFGGANASLILEIK